jgi:hypothetical protein
MRSRRSQAPAQSTSPAHARSVQLRFSDVSCAICKRLGASDAAPSSPMSLPARTAAPLARPSQIPTTRYSPARNRLSPQPATSSMHSRRSQASAHIASPDDARSVPSKSSDVSCAICKRLGASDAAPAASISLSARTAAPGTPLASAHHQLRPRAQPPKLTARNITSALPALASTRSQRSGPPMHAAYH